MDLVLNNESIATNSLLAGEKSSKEHKYLLDAVIDLLGQPKIPPSY